MEAFATVSDLEMRWRPLDDAERVRAGELLVDASAYVGALMRASGVAIGTDDEQRRNLASVCCAMVRRIMGVSEKLFGVSQYSQTAGSYTEMGTAANPNGDMYLTSAEKALLGISPTGRRQKGMFMRGAIHGRKGRPIDGW